MTARIATSDCHLYRVTDTVRGKFYIGKHRGRIQQGYWGSGMRVKRHIKKYGTADLKYEILVIASEEYIYDLEKRWLTEEYIKDNPDCLNLCKGGMGGNLGNTPWNKGMKMSAEFSKKISASITGRPSPRKGVVLSQESKDKIGMANKGKSMPISARERISKAHKGRKHELTVCPHCQKVGAVVSMPRWHFDNCKHKGQQSWRI